MARGCKLDASCWNLELETVGNVEAGGWWLKVGGWNYELQAGSW